MKKIIVCCDGTWNKPGVYENGEMIKTNVQKIYEALDEDEGRQVRFYDPGVGTGFSLKDKVFGGGFGIGIDRNLQDAYKFIMWNYEKGDQVYLYGFSRGAYTVRSLAGFIRNSGILKAGYLHLVEEAYTLYRDKTMLTHPDSDLMKGFRKMYGVEQDSNVYFIGVWDTVGALGIPITSMSWFNERYKFHDVKLSSKVRYAYHALAIDERRKIFEPSLWEVSEKSDVDQVCEQVWFAGVHSNVGGGYSNSGLSDIALNWMVEKSEAAGVIFNNERIAQIRADSCGELIDSASGIFKITPKRDRQINEGFVTRKNALTGKLEKVKAKTNERIHYTCFERCHKIPQYRPTNFFAALKNKTPYCPDEISWKEEWKPYLTINRKEEQV